MVYHKTVVRPNAVERRGAVCVLFIRMGSGNRFPCRIQGVYFGGTIGNFVDGADFIAIRGKINFPGRMEGGGGIFGYADDGKLDLGRREVILDVGGEIRPYDDGRNTRENDEYNDDVEYIEAGA